MVTNNTLLKLSLETLNTDEHASKKQAAGLYKTTILVTGLLIYLVYCTALQAANITVQSSRNPVAIDDSFHLLYEANGNIDDEPDFSPLSQDFDILSSSQSTNMRLINGNYSLKKSWDLSVIAKQTGKFTIPSIRFGNDLSPAIQITVHENTATNNLAPNSSSTNSSSTNPSSPNASPNSPGSIPASIFLESSLDKKETWVQAQLVYTIRLLRNISVIGGSLTETPETNDSDAIIHKISEDSYQTTRNNIRYEVFERRYTIFPQKSGTLKIRPMSFEGRISTRQARSIFDQFRMSGQLKRLRSKPLEVRINPAPPSINLQDWLPANDVKLVDEWSGDIQQIKTGEPITRTITIIADGLTGLQLPDLNIEDINNIKQYPDKPVIENKKSTNTKGIIGIKQIKIAMIPASAGRYTLPEIKLSWWNTTSNKKETASIPAKNIIAVGNVSSAMPEQVSTPTAPAISKVENKIEQSPTIVTTNDSNGNFWQGLSLFFATAWVITFFLLFKKRKPTTTRTHSPVKEKSKSVKSLASAVINHAKSHEAKQTKNALIAWAKEFFEDQQLNNLTQISQHCQATLNDEIIQLNQTLYSSEHVSWEGSKLLAAFKKQQKLPGQPLKNNTSALKPLYQK